MFGEYSGSHVVWQPREAGHGHVCAVRKDQALETVRRLDRQGLLIGLASVTTNATPTIRGSAMLLFTSYLVSSNQ